MDPETFDPETIIDPDLGEPMPNDAVCLYVWDDNIGVWNRARFDDLSPPLAKRIALLTCKGWLQEDRFGKVPG